MADVDLSDGGWKQTFIDLFAGATGGVAQVLIGKCGSIMSKLQHMKIKYRAFS